MARDEHEIPLLCPGEEGIRGGRELHMPRTGIFFPRFLCLIAGRLLACFFASIC